MAVCPSGLRGWTQVPLAQAAWAQIPQLSICCISLSLPLMTAAGLSLRCFIWFVRVLPICVVCVCLCICFQLLAFRFVVIPVLPSSRLFLLQLFYVFLCSSISFFYPFLPSPLLPCMSVCMSACLFVRIVQFLQGLCKFCKDCAIPTIVQILVGLFNF